MPLNTKEKLDLYTATVQDELKRVLNMLDKLTACRPEPGALESRDYILAAGVLWYTIQGGLRQTHGEATALQEDLEANIDAALLFPELVDLKAAVARVLEYRRMADPATMA